MKEPFFKRLVHGWNVFKAQESPSRYLDTFGPSNSSRPDRMRYRMGNERTIIASVMTRIAMDVSAVKFEHVRLNEEGRYEETINDDLNKCLSVEANRDQSGRAFIQDVVMSLLDEGCVAIVPVDTDIDPEEGSFKIFELRVGKILEWFPNDIRVLVYNEDSGEKEELIVPKRTTAIIENPLYAVMNEPNSTLKRLIYKLNLLDAIDEQNSSGKLDIIIQVPYAVKTESRQNLAEQRRKDIEMQLTGSKYGIAYTDGTERITQLNRPAENNLLEQIEYLTSMLYSQLGLSKAVFEGTADDKETLNYDTRTIGALCNAIADAMRRAFLTKTARTQGHSIMFFRDPFKLVPVSELADIADKLTRNEILSSNEFRAIIGYKPSKDPSADELRNKNINQPDNQEVVKPELPTNKEDASSSKEENQNGI